ncbi:V4R domain-containing protein [Candidatus Solincola sp.]|nr:4-vinyl reductase [Actinomycetota bacterium]MDI7252354.1 4-vinyl reductase [Actinomycetota bacterium]
MIGKLSPYQVKMALKLTDFLDRHPRLVRSLLRPIANAPLLRRYLWVGIRGFMGASAFDCHVIDASNGVVDFGGVKETFYPSCMTTIMRETLVQKVGEEKAEEVIRRIARESVYMEVKFGTEGRWFPRRFLSFMGDSSALEAIRSDPHLLRLVTKGLHLTNRFIHDEGGYGRIEVDLAADPIRITITNSLSARLAGRSDRPVCAASCGMMEGAISYMLGRNFRAREVQCAAMGAPRCVFELSEESTP